MLTADVIFGKKLLNMMEDTCLKCIKLNGNKNEWENNSQSPARLEESVMVMAQIFIY